MRKDENLKKLEGLWQGTEFIPSKFRPPMPSQDLIRELLGLSKEVKKRGIELHTLWEDNEEVLITLPRLMRQQGERQQRSVITVGVVRKARKELKDLPEPSQGQKGGNTAEGLASLSESEVEFDRHAPPPLTDQSASFEPQEDSMTYTSSPNNAARKVTSPERSPSSSDEGSSPVRKRKRDIRDEHAGKGSSRPSTDNSPISARSPPIKKQRSSYLSTLSATSSLESIPLPLSALAAFSEDSLPLIGENPFRRWLAGLDTQRGKCATHGTVVMTLYSRHQSCLADLNGFETEGRGIEKEIDALIDHISTDARRVMSPSRQLVHLEQELRRRADVVAQGIRDKTALQGKRDAILSLVPSLLLQNKALVVLCHIFSDRFVMEKDRVDRMEALQNDFLAQGARLLEES